MVLSFLAETASAHVLRAAECMHSQNGFPPVQIYAMPAYTLHTVDQPTGKVHKAAVLLNVCRLFSKSGNLIHRVMVHTQCNAGSCYGELHPYRESVLCCLHWKLQWQAV